MDGRRWTARGLFAVLIPPVLILAKRADSDADMAALADFVEESLRAPT